eukprot:9468936-Pyramimonas_sp.AAC.1
MAPKRRKARRLEGPPPSSDGDGGPDVPPVAPADPQPEFSNLGTLLLKAWTWGLKAATEVQQTAMAAFRDGLHHPEVQRLAPLGSWGHYPGNIHGQLTRMLGKSMLPDPLDITIPCLDPKTTA